MLDYIRSRILFRSPLVTVSDVICRPRCGSCEPEEQASTHSVVFPRTGIFVKRLSEKHRAVAEPTRVLFFNRHETYRVSHPVPGGDDCTALSFEEDSLLAFLRSVDPCVADSPSRPFRSPEATSSTPLVLNLHRLRGFLRRHEEADPLAVEEICAWLLAESVTSALRQRSVFLFGGRHATRQAHRDLAVAAGVMLAKTVREKLSLRELARAVFSSPFHLARVFRRETGRSLHRHQNCLRLRLALEHLADGAPDLTMLALDLGFSSHAHFTQAFRRELGCTPSQFRSKLCSRSLREGIRLLKA